MIPFRPVWIAAVGLAAVLMGCSGAPRLASQPSTPVNLTGHWVVEPSASDDAVALIKAALPHPKQQRKSRYDLWGNEVREGDEPGTYPPGSGRGADRRSGDGGGRSGRGSGRAGSDAGGDSAGYSAREAAPAWGRMRPYDYVAYFAAPPQRLDISQEATVVRVGSGDRMRAFIPGDRDPINLTDRVGSRALRGGWKGDAFVVSSNDAKNLRVLESYRHINEGRLDRVLEFAVPGVKSVTVHSVYRRATDAEISDSAVEGPPAPLR